MLSTLDIDLPALARDATGDRLERDGDHLLLLSQHLGTVCSEWLPVSEHVAGDRYAHWRNSRHYEPWEWPWHWRWSTWRLNLPTDAVLHAAEAPGKDRWMLGVVAGEGDRWYGTTDRQLAIRLLWTVARDHRRRTPQAMAEPVPIIAGWTTAALGVFCPN